MWTEEGEGRAHISPSRHLPSHRCQCGNPGSHVHSARMERRHEERATGEPTPHQQALRQWADQVMSIIGLSPNCPATAHSRPRSGGGEPCGPSPAGRPRFHHDTKVATHNRHHDSTITLTNSTRGLQNPPGFIGTKPIVNKLIIDLS